MSTTHHSSGQRWLDRLIDGAVTGAVWGYFTLGFIVLFSPRYIVAAFFPQRREERFQRFNSRFYQGFFALVRLLTPRHRWRIDPQVAAIRSSVIICNHVSYLDPLLFISLFERQKTVVKTVFFKVPIFGWVLRHAGYFPADSSGKFGRMMIEQVERMAAFLAAGGNFFIFPEGTRSRDGSLGTLNRGALKIARLCRAPIQVVHLANTGKLYRPGRFFFTTRSAATISLSLVERIEPDEIRELSVADLEQKIIEALRRQAESVQCSADQPCCRDARQRLSVQP
ncbi:MAG: 1-acyl-sn-glycerol-3-phosphate acyltransferase [Desulfofustis sp.]|nr:1-acyl-sn-glycerol-3-phosphate acyltransferase [Desulfofustis sp.]